jgi:hypothetical protein
MAQLAVGLTHAARGNRRGAAALLDRGARTVEPYGPAAPHGVDVPGLVAWARSRAADAAAGADVDLTAPRLTGLPGGADRGQTADDRHDRPGRTA